jgi:general secretion pathway protein K
LLRTREGMALLSVLILVAVLSVIAVVVLDDIRFSIGRTRNAETASQGQWYAIAAERLARRQIRRLVQENPARTPVNPQWNGRVFQFPIEQGAIQVTVTDGQACFNLNSLVEGGEGAWVAREEGVRQLGALARTLGVAEPEARGLASAAADWIDSDDRARPGGAEDAWYAGQPRRIRTGGTLMAEVSELRAVRGVDEALYRRLRPYLCALPRADLTRLNVNTLTPAQAPLLAMLSDGDLGVETARAAIAARPAGGWPAASDFWGQPALANAALPQTARDQATLATRYFDFVAEVSYAGSLVTRTGLIEVAPGGQVTTAIARWTRDE